jgi:hypothetical protein
VLDNGLVVETVDIQKEERERRRERSRARKSSRGSHPAFDGASVVSVPRPGTDSGYGTVGLRPAHRASEFSLGSNHRPMSVVSSPLSMGASPTERPPTGDRPSIPRAYSQYSLADSAIGSPRRSRFFGFGKSRDSLAMSGMSGSMVDMQSVSSHLHRLFVELMHGSYSLGQDISHVATEATHGAPGVSNRWSTIPPEERVAEEKREKKRKGLLKIWKIVTGTSRDRDARGPERVRSFERAEDDAPLAPPPPLSYLVSRGGGAAGPAPGMSFSVNTAPSSLLSSPVSARRGSGSGAPPEVVVDGEPEHDFRQSAFLGDRQSAYLGDGGGRQSAYLADAGAGGTVRREKSLPPLPPEAQGEPMGWDEPVAAPYGAQLLVPQAQRGPGAEGRRQSFNGLASTPAPVPTQTLPASATYGRAAFRALDEFGNARPPLGAPRASQESTLTAKGAKRRSRFALGSLFGKKAAPASQPAVQQYYAEPYGGMPAEYAPYAYGAPGAAAARRSRALEGLVDQDAEFVAYRYPSAADQMHRTTR